MVKGQSKKPPQFQPEADQPQAGAKTFGRKS